MIEIHGLTKAFGPRAALAGVDLEIGAGERVLLVGPNGAGKTTLLRILATLSRPTGGIARVAGCDVTRADARVRRMIGFLSHESFLYDDLTARQNLRFYARMYGLRDPDLRIEFLLNAVGLERRADDLVRGFSRGMQQRLAVARAVLHEPQLLLLDEPYTGLDAAAADALTAYLEALTAGGCTLLLTTHHPAEEGQLAQRVVVMRSGQVVEDGPVGELATLKARYRAIVEHAFPVRPAGVARTAVPPGGREL
jgi:heme exporter protein A